jgi:hypothetical protein
MAPLSASPWADPPSAGMMNEHGPFIVPPPGRPLRHSWPTEPSKDIIKMYNNFSDLQGNCITKARQRVLGGPIQPLLKATGSTRAALMEPRPASAIAWVNFAVGFFFARIAASSREGPRVRIHPSPPASRLRTGLPPIHGNPTDGRGFPQLCCPQACPGTRHVGDHRGPRVRIRLPPAASPLRT